MFERIGETTPPCGQPLSVSWYSQSCRYPALSMFRMSRKNRRSWIFSASIPRRNLMIKAPETVGDVTLDEPRGPAPGVVDLPQRGMTPSPFPEPVGPVGKPWLVNCLKEQANHFTNQLVGP